MFYRYTPDRKGEHPRAHLAGFSGILQADGYAGFAQLYSGNRIVEAACLAHARRKFFDVFEATKSPLAKTALEKIAALYRIEAEIRGRPPDERLRARLAQSAPLFADLKAWLETTLGRVPGRSDMAKAIRHSLSRWQAHGATRRARLHRQLSCGARHAPDGSRAPQLDLRGIGPRR